MGYQITPGDYRIWEAARVHNLPVELVQGMILQESSFDPTASKWEKGYPYIEPFRPKPPPSERDEICAQEHSYSLMQVMGATARWLGCTLPFLDALTYDVGLGLQYGCAYLDYQMERYDGKIEFAVSAYNAGSVRMEFGKFSNQPYVDIIMRNYAMFQGGGP